MSRVEEDPWYRDGLADWNAGWLNPDIPGLHNSYWMTTVVVDPNLQIEKAALIARMQSHDIDTRPFFSPLSSLLAYRDRPQAAVAREGNQVAYSITPFGINLPSALSLTEGDVARVCGALRAEVASLSDKSQKS